MKHITTLLVFVLLGPFSILNAQDHKMGLGLRFGNDDAVINNSVSLKYFFKKDLAIESHLSFGSPLALGLLLEKHKPAFSDRFTYFYGGGLFAGFGKGKFGDYRPAGVQGIVGLDYKFPLLPLNFSLDWKPEINLASEFSFEPAAIGLSARFLFK